MEEVSILVVLPIRTAYRQRIVASTSDHRGEKKGARTHVNPIGIDYKYSFEQKGQGISYRSWA
jgi:hypothetical protein